MYRRGWAGEPLREIPDEYVPGWGPEDRYSTEFPRSYVIPGGSRQHSAPAAARLVDLLVGSGGRVWQARRSFRAGRTTYPAGSYVIDLHQPKRGIVNSLLEPGIDITERVDDLYAGPAAWSQGLTWGATVDTLWDELPARAAASASTTARPRATCRGGRSDLLLDPQDAADLLALNALLEQDVEAYRLADGSVVVPDDRRARQLAKAQVREHGVTFEPAPRRWRGTELDEVDVGYVGGSEARDTLAALGFDARAVTAHDAERRRLTADVDVLLVAGTLDPATLTAENRAALDAFLARDGGVVGLGTAGASFSNADGAAERHRDLRPRARERRGEHRQPRRARHRTGAIPHSFISQPAWFTGLGAGAVVEQSYAADPLLAGWWVVDGPNGQSAAAGQASIVRAVAQGGNGLVLFGTNPIFRLHPKGLQPQLGRAVLWTSATESAPRTARQERACRTSATRSPVSSQPAENRMKPSGTASVPQRARRSAVEWTPPKLVASATRVQASRNACAASAEGSVNATTGPTPGQRTSLTTAHAAQRLRHRLRVGQRAFEPQPERGDRAVREPGLERSGHRAGTRPPGAQLAGERGVAHADGAEQHVAVADERLGAGEHREVGAVVERPDAERRGERVVHRQQRALGVRRRGDLGDVDDLELRVGGRLEPDERRVRDRAGDLGGPHEPHLDALGLEVLGGDLADARVAVARSDQQVAGPEPRKHHGGDRRHTRTRTRPTGRRRARRAPPRAASTSGSRRARSRTATRPPARAGGKERRAPGRAGTARPARRAAVRRGPRACWDLAIRSCRDRR